LFCNPLAALPKASKTAFGATLTKTVSSPVVAPCMVSPKIYCVPSKVTLLGMLEVKEAVPPVLLTLKSKAVRLPTAEGVLKAASSN